MSHNRDMVVPKTYQHFSFLQGGSEPVNPENTFRNEPYVDHKEGYWEQDFWDRRAADKKGEAESAKIREATSWPWETGQDLEGNPMPNPYEKKPIINSERWNRKDGEEPDPFTAWTPADLEYYSKDSRNQPHRAPERTGRERFKAPKSLDNL